MYFFASQWRNLSQFSCFTMEGSHRTLKRMLRNSGGLGLLRGRVGVQVVVDNHTMDDSLRAEGWDVTKRSMRGQGPVSVQQLARRARKRALSDLNYVHTLTQLSDATSSANNEHSTFGQFMAREVDVRVIVN